MKKLLSYLTSFVLALSVFAGFARVGSAETATETEKNDTKETATQLSFTETNDVDYPFSAVGQGSLENNEDVDYYKFTLTKDGGIDVELSQIKNAEIQIDLLNDKNEELQSWYLTEGQGIQYLFSEGLPAGNYYLKAAVHSGTVDPSSNSYELRVLNWQDNYYEKESNDDFATATPMALNKFYSGYTDADGEDIYKVKTTATGKLTVRGTYSPNVEMNYYLMDTKNNVIEDWTIEADPEADETLYTIFTVGVKPGTYYLVASHDIENDEVYNEPYRVQANFVADSYSEQEVNGTTATSTPINLKRTYNGIMSWKDDIDTYKVNVKANANITLGMSQAPSTVFKAVIVDSKNKVVKTLYTKKGKGSMVTLGNVNLAKGIYYVKVQYSSGSYEQVPYKLQLLPKIYWGKVVYKPGMTGKTVALSTSKVYKLKSGKLYYVKTVAKGTETAVYGSDKYGYKLGSGLYMKKDRTVKYYTVPSSIKTNYSLVNN